MIRTDSSEWQSSLIGLLARLEHLRAELTDRRLTADAALVVDVAERMVLAAEDLAARTPFPDDSLPLQAEAVGRAGVFFTAATVLKRPPVQKQKGLFRSVFSAGEEAVPVDVKAVRDCLADAVEALHGYFGLFTDRFLSSAQARGWVDAATAYLVDLKQQIKSLPEY